MKSTRRAALGSIALAASGCVTSAAQAAKTAPASGARLSDFPKAVGLEKMPALRRDRASAIMKQLGLDGLLLTTGPNMLYAAGFDKTYLVRSLDGDGPPAFVFVPQDPTQPVGVVLTSYGYYYGYANVHPEGIAAFQYTESRPPSLTDPSNTTGILATGRTLAAGEPAVFPDSRQAPLDLLESERARRTLSEAASHGIEGSAEDALRRCLKTLGRPDGRYALDASAASPSYAIAARALGRSDLQDATAAISKIRLVKSPDEIAAMRYAARANAAAARAACLAVRAGATVQELRSCFYAEAARRGGLGSWITIDRMSADAYRADFRDGQAFMIDAVSIYGGYHGDYGRTVLVGDPAKPMLRHTRAIEHAWGAVREALKPGLRFSDIQRIGQTALEKGGFDTVVRITPHSVGILHTDAYGIGDIELEKGMIVSVDFPVMQAGIGGSAHLEDLTLITADGHELLNDTANPVIAV